MTPVIDKSTFHKLIFKMVFEGDDFDPSASGYEKEWDEWIDNAAGQLHRCLPSDWDIGSIDIANKEIVINFSGKDAHHGQYCSGVIFSDLDGKVTTVDPG